MDVHFVGQQWAMSARASVKVCASFWGVQVPTARVIGINELDGIIQDYKRVRVQRSSMAMVLIWDTPRSDLNLQHQQVTRLNP